jgi:hypothetical protein
MVLIDLFNPTQLAMIPDTMHNLPLMLVAMHMLLPWVNWKPLQWSLQEDSP